MTSPTLRKQKLAPPPVVTKFHENRVLAYLEREAIKAGQVYTEIESKKGLKFKGRRDKKLVNTFALLGYMDEGTTDINGPGILQKPDGYVYEGQFKNSQPHGFGVFEFDSGVKFEGVFKDGKKHGVGLLRETKDGPDSPVRFEDDKRVDWPIPTDVPEVAGAKSA